MPLKVTWRKGMRLGTDVFNALDASIDESIRLSNLIATGGGYGLIPVSKPFELSVNVSNDVLEIVSLSCHGVTKSGMLIDVEFDSNFAHTFDTRVSIPTGSSEEAFLLVIKLHDRQLREVNEMYSEQVYTFELIGENSPIDSDSLPIGCLVNQYGWRLDETDFVPPCLFIGAHVRYVELVNRAKLVVKSISDRCFSAHNCVARHLLGILWPEVAYAYSTIDKTQERLTPATLFAELQKVVSAFVIGCSVDEFITLENTDPFIAYSQRPYDGRNLYSAIQKGIELCTEISIKMDAVCNMTEIKATPAPPIVKPAPKPQPSPEPKPMGRNRWEGIEI